MMSSRSKLAVLLALAAGATTLTRTSASQAAHAINGNFAESTALTTVYHQARLSFAEWTTWGSGPGGVTQCPTIGDWVNCWIYWQPEPSPGATYAALRVEALVNSHYHLSFEDQNISCIAFNVNDGGGSGFGRSQGGTCVPADWVHEPRTVDSHNTGEWYYVSIEAWNNSLGTQGYRYFDLTSFNVKSDPVNLWVLWYDGYWYELTNLGPGVVNVSDWAYDILAAEIGSDTGYTSLDDVIVGQVYL